MPQQFTITLTDEEAAGLKELAAYWNGSLEEALRRAAVEGLDMALQIKAHDEQEAAGIPRSGDLDDGIRLRDNPARFPAAGDSSHERHATARQHGQEHWRGTGAQRGRQL
jgi:hypothetical protein